MTPIKLTANCSLRNFPGRLVAKITREQVPASLRPDYALVTSNVDALQDYSGYGCIFVSSEKASSSPVLENLPVAVMADCSHLHPGYVVSINDRTGFVRTVYRPESPHNTLFATDRCNSNCLMCSQPPKDIDDSYLIGENLKIIDLIDEGPEVIGITGGEPTLLGSGLIEVLDRLKTKLPRTSVHMLTNGRKYANARFAHEVGEVRHPSFVSGIPLYADVAAVHDYVVQSEGAFDETLEGIYNAAQSGLAIEIRVVLHKQTIPRLVRMAEFIYANFPFVSHVALMGLENMGYVKKNWSELWIDPVHYMDELRAAALFLHRRGLVVSIYNLQLCLLPRELHFFARQSISDFKNVYLPECDPCLRKGACSGFFLSQVNRHSEYIRPFLTA